MKKKLGTSEQELEELLVNLSQETNFPISISKEQEVISVLDCEAFFAILVLADLKPKSYNEHQGSVNVQFYFLNPVKPYRLNISTGQPQFEIITLRLTKTDYIEMVNYRIAFCQYSFNSAKEKKIDRIFPLTKQCIRTLTNLFELSGLFKDIEFQEYILGHALVLAGKFAEREGTTQLISVKKNNSNFCFPLSGVAGYRYTHYGIDILYKKIVSELKTTYKLLCWKLEKNGNVQIQIALSSIEGLNLGIIIELTERLKNPSRIYPYVQFDDAVLIINDKLTIWSDQKAESKIKKNLEEVNTFFSEFLPYYQAFLQFGKKQIDPSEVKKITCFLGDFSGTLLGKKRMKRLREMLELSDELRQEKISINALFNLIIKFLRPDEMDIKFFILEYKIFNFIMVEFF